MVNSKKSKKNIVVAPNSALKNKTGAWRTFKPTVDLTKCIGCGVCVKVCPEGTIDLIDIKGQKKSQINYDYCKGCGVCSAQCPVKAIVMNLEK